jgi:phosphoribosylamine---glycine ligase
MRVLVIGGGGREHALCWRLRASATVEEVVCAPGNAGIAAVARLREVDPHDPAAVARLAVDEGVDLAVVGPEGPLAAGVVDALAESGVPVFGPTASAARLESSKSFAKQIMDEAGVPTGAAWAGGEVTQALDALDRFGPPYVVKADGLAAGKGVVVTEEREQAEAAVRAALEEGAFGPAGQKLLVEEFLDGPEVSAFAVSDGREVRMLTQAQDYKRARDGDEGPNTGGMGAYSPVYLGGGIGNESLQEAVFSPVVAALRERGTPYVGVLYAGLVLTDDGPQVLEFNARFGDPEAQVILPRLRSDLGALLAGCAHGELGAIPPLEWDRRAAVTVVLASGGYPGEYRTGLTISGLDGLTGMPDVAVFHAGTRRDGGRIVTAGGRVLTVTGLGDTVADARTTAYAAADRIEFEGLTRRGDIAALREDAPWPA